MSMSNSLTLDNNIRNFMSMMEKEVVEEDAEQTAFSEQEGISSLAYLPTVGFELRLLSCILDMLSTVMVSCVLYGRQCTKKGRLSSWEMNFQSLLFAIATDRDVVCGLWVKRGTESVS